MCLPWTAADWIFLKGFVQCLSSPNAGVVLTSSPLGAGLGTFFYNFFTGKKN